MGRGRANHQIAVSAKRITALRDTGYARELTRPVVQPYPGGNEIRLERLWIKAQNAVEIRLSWWKDGKMVPRPPDLPEDDFIRMLAEGFRTGVLGPESWERLESDCGGQLVSSNVEKDDLQADYRTLQDQSAGHEHRSRTLRRAVEHVLAAHPELLAQVLAFVRRAEDP